MPQESRAFLFAIVTVLFWSTVATAFKFTLRHLDIFQLLFYACLTSVAALALIVILQGKVNTVVAVFRKHWKITLVAGGLNPGLYYLVLFEAYDRLPAQVAQPINYTWAIMLSILSIIFLKQKITPADFSAALICYTGVLIIATQGDFSSFAHSDLIGLALALFSTIIWATYWILNVKDPRDPVTGMFLNFSVALVPVGIACIVFSSFTVPMEGLSGAVYVGLFEMSLAFLCWSTALRLTSNTSRISNLIFLSPFLSLIFIHQILGETIYTTTYIGLVIITCGLLIQQWYHSRPGRS
jgi:drug/metabolite transporter (DMT)-like permease